MTQSEGNAQLRRASWLRRAVEIHAAEEAHVVEYSGWGFGFETVRVNGQIAVRKTSWRWFVAHFDFSLGDVPVAIDVQVWPWLTIRRFVLSVQGEPAYTEVHQFQFTLRTIAIVIVVCAVLLAILRWLDLFVRIAAKNDFVGSM